MRMDDSLFARIWDVAVCDVVDKVFSSIPQDVRRKYRMTAHTSDVWRSIVYRKYIVHNKEMHENYFKGKLIDVHKILACLLAALLDVDLIGYDKSMSEDDLRPHICVVRAKYVVAMLSPLKYLYLYMQRCFAQNGKENIAKILAMQGNLLFPKPVYEHGKWLYNRISALALNHILGNKIDTLSYADMMFWVELYNREHLEWSSMLKQEDRL